MKLQGLNTWYGFDHEEVNKRFDGNLTFLGTFCIKGQYEPSAVYVAAQPDLSKGHKKYMALTKSGGLWYVQGCDEEEMEKYRSQDVLHCKECDEVIYSVMRHDFHSCSCESVSIDGGNDYTRCLFKSRECFEIGSIDFVSQLLKIGEDVFKIEELEKFKLGDRNNGVEKELQLGKETKGT